MLSKYIPCESSCVTYIRDVFYVQKKKAELCKIYFLYWFRVA